MSNLKRYTAVGLAVLVAGTAATVLPSALATELSVKDSGNSATVGTELINLNTEWKYLDDNTDPAGTGERTSWTTVDFDDSAWKTSAGYQAKFGAKYGELNYVNGCLPEVLLNQYIEGEDETDIPAFFFRTSFELDNTPENLDLIGTLKYDDAVIIYI